MLLNGMCLAVVGCSLLELSLRSRWSMTLIRPSLVLLTRVWGDVWWQDEREEVLKSLTMIVDLSVFPLNSLHFLPHGFWSSVIKDAPANCPFAINILVLSLVILCHYICLLCDNRSLCSFLQSSVCTEFVFPLVYCSLTVAWILKCISCRQHMVRSCFFIILTLSGFNWNVETWNWNVIMIWLDLHLPISCWFYLFYLLKRTKQSLVLE